MSRVIVELKPSAALFTNLESEEAKFQNLLLNIISGLEYKHLNYDEKELLAKYGYNP